MSRSLSRNTIVYECLSQIDIIIYRLSDQVPHIELDPNVPKTVVGTARTTTQLFIHYHKSSPNHIMYRSTVCRPSSCRRAITSSPPTPSNHNQKSPCPTQFEKRGTKRNASMEGSVANCELILHGQQECRKQPCTCSHSFVVPASSGFLDKIHVSCSAGSCSQHA